MRYNVLDRFTAQLMFSADSRRWQRVRCPEPFLDTGAAGGFDRDYVNLLSNGVIRHKNRLRLNYDPRRDLDADPKHCTGEVRVEVRDPDDNPIPGFTRDECLVPTDRTSRTVNAYSDKHYTEADDAARPEYLPVRWRDGATARQLAGRRIKLGVLPARRPPLRLPRLSAGVISPE